PGAVSAAANRIDVFARGLDNALWHRAWDGTAWQPWQSLGGVLSSGPAVTASGASRLDVFARGGDGALWHRAWDGAGWLAWENLGGRLTSDPGRSRPARARSTSSVAAAITRCGIARGTGRAGARGNHLAEPS